MLAEEPTPGTPATKAEKTRVEKVQDMLQAKLGKEAADIFTYVYSVTPAGNWEESNILHRVKTDEQDARMLGISVAALQESVTITAGVSANSAPVANASVTFTITKANGIVVKQTATTGASGTAVSQLRLKKTDPVGTSI